MQPANQKLQETLQAESQYNPTFVLASGSLLPLLSESDSDWPALKTLNALYQKQYALNKLNTIKSWSIFFSFKKQNKNIGITEKINLTLKSTKNNKQWKKTS